MRKEDNPLDMRDWLVEAKKQRMFIGKLSDMGKAVIESTGKPKY